MGFLALTVLGDTVAEGEAGVFDPVAHRLETRVVVQPLTLDSGFLPEEVCLFTNSFLLAVAAVQGVRCGVKLLAVGLGNLPWAGCPERHRNRGMRH